MGGRQGVERDQDPYLQAALATASKSRQVQGGQGVCGLDLLDTPQGGNEEVEGQVEFFDQYFIRLTRNGEPNLFLYKHDIKYLYES